MNQTTITLPWISAQPIKCEFEHFQGGRKNSSSFPLATINRSYSYIGLNSCLMRRIPNRAKWVQILFDRKNLIICLSVNNVEDRFNYNINRSNNAINCSAFLRIHIEPILGKLKTAKQIRAFWNEKNNTILIPLDETKLMKSAREKEAEELD